MKRHPVFNETPRHEGVWEMEVQLQVFLTSAVDGDGGASRPGHLTSFYKRQ